MKINANQPTSLAIAAVLALTTLMPSVGFACASCGCSLSTDAAMGYSAQPGWRINLQYDYIDQNQLRTGTGTATPSQVINDPTTGELEHQTINRSTTVGLSYLPNPAWAFNLQVPYLNRSHSSYTDALSAPLDPADLNDANISSSHSSSLGDAKFIVNYQGFLPTHNLGVQLGLKLPTGDYGNHVHFSSGPSTGEVLDASLQPGNGSTDLIVGAYDYQAVSQNWDAFVSGQFQSSIAQKLDQTDNDFRPGNQASMSLGARYMANSSWVPQAQINIVHKTSDQGALADTADSAGTLAYLSPGVMVNVMKKWQAYGFVQVPVYSNLDGYQLAPRWTATVGMSHSF